MTTANQAIKKAKKAFPDWSGRSFEERKKILQAYQLRLKEDSDLATLISEEVGKPLWESKQEVAAMVAKVTLSVEAFNDRCRERVIQEEAMISCTRFRPHGVVGVLGPFNFPGHLPNGHIVPALLAGNTVVFKPSEFTPKTGDRLIAHLHEAGVPEDAAFCIQGGKKVGEALSLHEDLNALFFTGSADTGLLLSKHFGNHPEKLLALEMGGNNPLVVGSIKNLDAAVEMILLSAYLTSGQRCTAARRLIVLDEIKQPIIQKLYDRAKKLKVGFYTETPEPFMGPVISEDAADFLMTAQQNLVALGASSLLPMKEIQPKLLTPGILDTTQMRNRPDLELFGPLLQVISVPDLDAAIKEANATKFGLSAGILTDEKKEWELFLEHVRAGIMNWNRPLTGASSKAPFGGVGLSGNFRPSAYFAADYCSYPVASLESAELKELKTPYPGMH